MSDDLTERLAIKDLPSLDQFGDTFVSPVDENWVHETFALAAARIADLERQLAEARDALAVSAGRLTWCAGILPSKKLRDLVSEWADEARILSALKDPTP